MGEVYSGIVASLADISPMNAFGALSGSGRNAR
jgi:hypothetical protein